MPTSTATAAGPQVVLRIGDEIAIAVDNLLVARDTLPAGTTNVWATTLDSDSSIPAPNADVIHLFGLSAGRAFQQDIGPTSSGLTDLGAATAVLQTQEYPVLVHDGEPVKVGSPVIAPDLGLAGAELPVGWSPGRFENLGYSGLLIKPVGASGNVEIASWSPGGVPHPVTKSGRLLGVSDAGQAMWLDPSCPDGPNCALYVGDIGGVHPGGGVRAPTGARFVDSPASLGGGGYLAAAAIGRQGEPMLVLVAPWQGTAAIINGSAGVVTSSGMFWLDGTHLIFAADNAATGGVMRLVEFDVNRGTVTPFGPPLPENAQLLTAFGSTGGVSVLP
ncbi:MAG TPA: hypothetical protein VF218_08360 [Acidothermaceae bacterium]